MDSLIMIAIAVFCNFILMCFLARRYAYKLILSRIPIQIVSDIYKNDVEISGYSAIMNFIEFFMCVIFGYLFLAPFYAWGYPFIALIIAKIWAPRLAKAKLRLYTLQWCIEHDIQPEELVMNFAQIFQELMQFIDINYLYFPSDAPTILEIGTAYLEVKKKTNST